MTEPALSPSFLAFDGLLDGLARVLEPGAAERRLKLNRGVLCRYDLETVIDRDAHEERGEIVEIVADREEPEC